MHHPSLYILPTVVRLSSGQHTATAMELHLHLWFGEEFDCTSQSISGSTILMAGALIGSVVGLESDSLRRGR